MLICISGQLCIIIIVFVWKISSYPFTCLLVLYVEVSPTLEFQLYFWTPHGLLGQNIQCADPCSLVIRSILFVGSQGYCSLLLRAFYVLVAGCLPLSCI
jgi:hypothetical protein